MARIRSVSRAPGGIYDLGYHVVWCPKFRRAVLTGDVADRLKEIITEVCDSHGWTMVTLEVMPDHVHVFVKADPSSSPAYVANQMKRISSRLIRQEFPHIKSRLPNLWSRSYFIGSAGIVSADTVRRYLDTQWDRPWRKDNPPAPVGPADEVLL